MRASRNSHIRMEAAAGFLPWLISKVAPPLLPPQALSNQQNHSDKYSRRKAAGLAWEGADGAGSETASVLRTHCNGVTCMYLN